jgi:plastocyanin
MRTPLHRVLCVAAIAALPLAACGGDDDEGADTGGDAPAGDAVVVHAQDSLAFDPEALEAPAGAISFRLENDGSLPHTFVIEDHESDMKLSVGSSDEGTITLEEGEYTFYCDVAGHRGGGMEGTLQVGPAAP